ncbi:MAG: ABC transporter permease [Planctomycetes bacterium]|nr:ABC transporter permease [Planctomycetota bacterium]
MSPLRYIISSLRHYRRIHIAVALGVAVATAVLTGALLVGDSVSGSLRDLTLQRLGRINSALVVGHMFREALADELAATPEFRQHFTTAEPAILMTVTLQSGSGRNVRRAAGVSVIGSRPEFWSLGQGEPAPRLTGDEVAITEPLARELVVEAGDDVLLRLPIVAAIPADSPLGEKSETSTARRLKVAAVLPIEGISRFSLMPSQHLPRNAFVSLTTMQSLLDKPESANAILVASNEQSQAADEAAHRTLSEALRPHLIDYGVRVEQVASPSAYSQISSDALVLPDEVVRAAEKSFGDGNLQPVSAYLANTLVVGDGNSQRKIPYSTIAGVDSIPGLGPLLDADGSPIILGGDEIVLNRWAADDLQVKVGDSITVTFYEPESTHGELREHAPSPVFKLRAIVDLETADGQPTHAADSKLTPELPGVTDQESIRDWELPFELVETIRPQDEDYWDEYRTTPKAFVSLATAKRLWPSRWGTISLLRIPVDESLRDSNSRPPRRTRPTERLARAIDPAALGLTFLPVKQLGLQASSGTTPFGGLFLGFSFFLIAAALMLIALLFQLGIQQRAGELGTLAAVGVAKKRIAGLLGREGLLVAVVGASVGVAFGILYAWLMVAGLRTWWLAAISTPFLELHLGWPSLLIGWLAGVALSWLTIRWSIWRLLRNPAARLLSGSVASQPEAMAARRSRAGIWPKARVALVVLIVGLVVGGFKLQGEAQAGAFFGSGAAVLVLLLGEIRRRLAGAGRIVSASRHFSLAKLSRLNAARNPGRSTLTIGLVAAASFLIVAISAFRLETSDAGTGGFDYIATSDQPLHYDLNTPEGRLELGFSDDASQELAMCDVYSMRVAGGEDASCLNLYRPTQPRVLGVPIDFVARGGFAWAATQEPDPALAGNPGASAIYERFFRDADEFPWRDLNTDIGKDERGQPIVPMVLDASTAVYSLHLKGIGSQLTIRDAADQPVTLQVVGLLKNSVLQGNLLVSEDHFLRLFPDTGGYRFFLIEDRGKRAVKDDVDGTRSVPATLESTLADEGFDVVDAREQLAAFLAVQNTYLSTFQSLGALGLLLGTIGLAVVQLRSVLERRGELALMRAGGFSRSRLVRMVIWENAVLLLGGLAVGCIAAAVALLPQWAPQGANVPWITLAALLGTIAVAGLAAGWLATRSALRVPILPALRGD